MISKIVRANGSILQNVKSCTFSETVNAETNLKYGCVSASKIDVVCYGTKADAVTAGEELTYYQVVNGTEKLIGKFYAEPAIPSRMTYSFTAYDVIAKLDVDFSARLAELQPSFPMTVGDLVEEAVTVAGVPWVRENFTNSGKTVQAFYADGITCREIVSWAAELASDFVRCSKAGTGRMVFARYTAKDGYVIAPGVGSTDQNAHVAYRENGLTYANYTFSLIDAVAVHPTDDEDLAYIYPTDATGDNILHIRGNLLLTNASASTYNSIAQSIYSRTQNISNYRPFEARLFPDENPFRAGDIVHVIDAQGVSFDTVVFSMTVNQTESILTATGEQSYSEQTAASAKNRLTNLAANIVRIKNLFVEQLEALAAQIDSLFTREITVTGSLHSEDYRQASGQPYAASGMALNFDTEEIIAPYFALDEYGNILGNSAYFGDMYFSDAMYGPESVINLAPDSMKDASGATSTNYEAVSYLRPINNQRSLVRPGEVTEISGYQIGENGTFIYTFPKYTRYLRFWALCDSEQISELAVPHVKIYAVAQGHTSLAAEFDLTKYGTYQMPYNHLVSAVPYYYYPVYRTPDVSNYYQIEITLPNATCVCVDYAFGHYSAWHSYDNGHTFGGAGTYVGTDGISAQKIALKATPIAYPCNPNLIRNWYFAGGGSQGGAGKFPINQRGQTTYSAASSYGIDMWSFNSNPPTVTLNSNGITLNSAGSSEGFIRQVIDCPYEDLAGKTVTFSVLYDGGLATGTGVVPDTPPSSLTTIISLVGQIPHGGSTYNRLLYYDNTLRVQIGQYQGELTFIAAKVELGDTH